MRANRTLPAVLACLVMTLAGCFGPQVRPVPPRSRAEVLSALDERAASLRTLSARLSIKAKLAGMKKTEKLSANFAAAGPASLRLRGEHPLLDHKPLDIGCDGTTWWVHVRYEDVNRVDYGKLAEIARFDLDVPIRPDQIVALLGMTPLRDKPGVSNWVFTVHPGCYRLQEIVRADGSRYVATRIELDGDTNLMRMYETLLPSGRTDMSAIIERYRTVNGVPIARTMSIRIKRGERDEQLDFEFKDVKVNPDLPGNVFKPLRFDRIPQRFRHPRDLVRQNSGTVGG